LLSALRRRAHLGLLQVYRRLPRRARLAVVHTLAPSFSVGAIAVVERHDGALLLVRHSYRERWGTPGGLLKRGEHPSAAAIRECWEEVGVDIELVSVPVVVVEPDARRVDIVFAARPRHGRVEVTPGSPEIVEVRWFARHELPELQHETRGALAALARSLDQ